MQFIIFFSIVLSIYFFANYYVYYHGLKALPEGSLIKKAYVWVFWIIASTYFVGRIIERIHLSYFSDALVWIGSFWLGALLYFFLIVLLIDVIRLINHFLPFFPELITANYQHVKTIILGVSVLVVSAVLIAGFINARNPVIKEVEISIPKRANSINEINAVLISDIHLGTIIGSRYLDRVLSKVSGLKPDIIFITGDILDEDLEPVIRQNLGEKLKKLSAPMGVYAIMGNHEHIGGADPAYDYLKTHGMTVLRDTAIQVNNSFYLIGRDDNEAERFGSKPRIPLEEIMTKIDNNDLPIILLDHQPLYLQKAADLGVDLQLSGHTHKGQLWPITYIVNAIYRVGYGYDKIDNMQVFVSSGIGTWGPPIRVGSRSEIVKISIRFEKE